MYSTGDPDRAPVRCTEPTGYAHTGPEAAFAALTAWWTGAPQRVDVSMQEVVLVANMATPARFPQTGFRGSAAGRQHRPHPRDLADARRLRVVRPARRQGARPEPRAAVEAAWTTTALHGAGLDRVQPEHRRPTRTLRAIEQPIAEYFAAHTMQELYDIACETNLMLAPANSPREIYASAPARGARLLRPGRRRRAVPADVRHRARRRRRGRAGPAARSAPTVRTPDGPSRAVNRSNGRGRRGRRPDPRVRFRRGRARSRPATSPSTARRCSGSSRSRGPTSSACTRSGPTTRTGSRARRCTTGSTSASATSRST